MTSEKTIKAIAATCEKCVVGYVFGEKEQKYIPQCICTVDICTHLKDDLQCPTALNDGLIMVNRLIMVI